MVELDRVSLIDVCASYFSGSPPFGEGKKKYEFPDAFALLALQREAKDRNKMIYVVSGDSDWEKFCSSSDDLNLIGKLDDLLETIIGETDSDDVYVCYDLYNQKEEKIKKYIADNFLDLEFSLDRSGTSLIEGGSEEIEVEVNSVDITRTSLVDIDDFDAEHPLVVFELDAEVNFSAKVSYVSLEYATYDREYETYYNVEKISMVSKESIILNAEVTLTLSRDKYDSLCDSDIKSINIDPNNNLGEIIIDTGYDDDYY
ncbi:MAG: DUF4935 domain-containing protein [Desertifilum sp. SIO1I2]|nr:DUF4935 domain-containing protein [Desertifilum sp. SIO1I2]